MTIEKIIQVSNLEIHVTLRSGQKNSYIRVTPPNGDIIASVPAGTSDSVIKNFVLRKITEITKARERLRQQFRQSKREYVSGESVYYWGVQYMLQVVYCKGRHSKIERLPNKIIMTVPAGTPLERRRKLLTEWYRLELKNMLQILVRQCEKKLSVKINDCRVRNMKTRWGSCNVSKKSILINLQLVKKPLECLEYVLTHEFIHLLEKNHTNRFRILLGKYCPAWREAKQLLIDMPLDSWEEK